jgi:hypothetical protein
MVGRSDGRTVGLLEGGDSGIEMDGAEEAVALPVLGMRRDDGVGGDDGEPQPARRGEDGVALLAGAKLGVEVAGAALVEDALEEGGVAGEEDQPLTVVREGCGQAVGSVIPSEARDLLDPSGTVPRDRICEQGLSLRSG